MGWAILVIISLIIKACRWTIVINYSQLQNLYVPCIIDPNCSFVVGRLGYAGQNWKYPWKALQLPCHFTTIYFMSLYTLFAFLAGVIIHYMDQLWIDIILKSILLMYLWMHPLVCLIFSYIFPMFNKWLLSFVKSMKRFRPSFGFGEITDDNHLCVVMKSHSKHWHFYLYNHANYASSKTVGCQSS